MRLVKKLSFVSILILALFLSHGFAYAQQNYIGEDEIVIEDISYKNIETEFQKSYLLPNEINPFAYGEDYFGNDIFPSLDGQAVSPTILCEDASQSKCYSIGNVQGIAVGEPVYGAPYNGVSLWQKVIYDGKIYYVPYDKLNFEFIAQPTISVQNPLSDYTGATISACDLDCQKRGWEYYNKDYEYEKWLANNQQYGQSFAELTGGGLVNSALWVWDGGLLGLAEQLWSVLSLVPDIPVIPITYVISDIPAIHKGSVEFTKGISGWLQENANWWDNYITESLDSNTGLIPNSYSSNAAFNYLTLKAATEWGADLFEGLWGFYADPSDKITNIAYAIKDPGGVTAAHLHNVNRDLDGFLNNYDPDKTQMNAVKIGLDILISPKLILGALGITGKSVIIADNILTVDNISEPGKQARENKYNLSEELGITVNLIESVISKMQNKNK